jgi:hypothetical protein
MTAIKVESNISDEEFARLMKSIEDEVTLLDKHEKIHEVYHEIIKDKPAPVYFNTEEDVENWAELLDRFATKKVELNYDPLDYSGLPTDIKEEKQHE